MHSTELVLSHVVNDRKPRLLRLALLGLMGLFCLSALQQARLHWSQTPLVSHRIDLAPADRINPELALGPKALIDRWNPLIEEAAQKFRIPAAWIKAVMQRESGGRTMLRDGSPIVSSAGAQGLMQLMPDTYAQLARQLELGDDPFDSRDNIFAAAAYLRWLHSRYGFPAMFAAYNDGPGNWEDYSRHKRALPLETRNYLKSVTQTVRAVSFTQVASVVFTRPDGTHVDIDAQKVTGVRVPHPGEYAATVRAVIHLGRKQQGVREPIQLAANRLRQAGAEI